MNFLKPFPNGITIYSKSGCINCVRVKHLLIENNISFSCVDCDEYLLEDKEAFLKYIKEIAGKEYNMFPMIFIKDEFIGGFTEMKYYIESQVLDFNNNF